MYHIASSYVVERGNAYETVVRIADDYGRIVAVRQESMSAQDILADFISERGEDDE